MPATPSPVLSVVVPTYNRVASLRRALAALVDQDLGEPYEIIVVSDGSTDGTAAFLADYEPPVPLRFERQDNAGPSVARNRGVEMAAAPLVVFVDDDIVADRGLLRAHLEAQREAPDGVVVTGPMLTPPDHAMTPWIRWEQERLERNYDHLAAGRYPASGRLFYTGNASAPVAMIQAAGGFDPAFRRAEDMELGMRLQDAGAAFRFVPEARGHHYAERSYEAWKRIAYDYGVNDMVFARRWPGLLDVTRRHWTEAPALVRIITLVLVATNGVGRAILGVLEPIARRRTDRIGQALLSLVYRVGYTSGVRDGLGSFRALRRLHRTGRID